jgi:glycosyltransferase involved in cell wall biosynthesis
MLVSIIIPLYNKEQYFKRCFNSVVRQTYKNIECIIVEDCSTDKSLELAECLIKDLQIDSSISVKLIKHDQNAGQSAARNTGIKNSHGDYLYFLDSDDEITENCIKSLVDLAIKYPDVEIIQGNGYQYPRVEKDRYEYKGTLPEFVVGNSEIKKNYSRRLPVGCVNKLVRKKFIIENNLYFKNLRSQEDKHWRFFMLKKLENFAFTEEYCYIRYYVPDSVMTNPNLFFSISANLAIADDILSNLDIDLLNKQLLYVRRQLNRQKEKILSDEKYSSLLPECEALLKRLPRISLLVIFDIRGYLGRIKRALSKTKQNIMR